jgi:hypothetical protein
MVERKRIREGKGREKEREMEEGREGRFYFFMTC